MSTLFSSVPVTEDIVSGKGGRIICLMNKCHTSVDLFVKIRESLFLPKSLKLREISVNKDIYTHKVGKK